MAVLIRDLVLVCAISSFSDSTMPDSSCARVRTVALAPVDSAVMIVSVAPAGIRKYQSSLVSRRVSSASVTAFAVESDARPKIATFLVRPGQFSTLIWSNSFCAAASVGDEAVVKSFATSSALLYSL